MKERFRIWSRLQTKIPKGWKAEVPGLKGISWYRFLSFYLVRADREDIRMRASFMAFHFMLALFPAIIFFFTLVAYLPIKDADRELLELIQRLMPDNAFRSLSGTLQDILEKQRGGLLSVGFLAAVYFSTSAIDSMIRSFHHSLHISDRRPYYKKKLNSILLNLYFSLLLITTLVFVTMGDAFIDWLKTEGLLGNKGRTGILKAMNWVVVVMLIQLIVSSLYRFGPYQRDPFRFFSRGSFITTFLIVAMSVGLSYYVNQFNSYNRIYGSIGTLLVVMLWIYWNCVMTLIGFEFNIFLKTRKDDAEDPPAGDNMLKDNTQH